MKSRSKVQLTKQIWHKNLSNKRCESAAESKMAAVPSCNARGWKPRCLDARGIRNPDGWKRAKKLCWPAQTKIPVFCIYRPKPNTDRGIWRKRKENNFEQAWNFLRSQGGPTEKHSSRFSNCTAQINFSSCPWCFFFFWHMQENAIAAILGMAGGHRGEGWDKTKNTTSGKMEGKVVVVPKSRNQRFGPKGHTSLPPSPCTTWGKRWHISGACTFHEGVAYPWGCLTLVLIYLVDGWQKGGMGGRKKKSRCSWNHCSSKSIHRPKCFSPFFRKQRRK